MEKVKCKSCKEEINIEASKCPHCHGWQTKWGLDFQNPKSTIIFIFIFLFICMPLFILLISYLEDYVTKTKTHTRVQETSYEVLKISNSSLETYTCGDRKCVAIFGVIDNESNYMWTNIHFHAELFDKNEQMIDVFSEKDYDIVAPANSSTTFRISRIAVRDLSEYSGHKISIRWAIKIDE